MERFYSLNIENNGMSNKKNNINTDNIYIKQLPGKTNCPWHKEHQKKGKIYKTDEIFPDNMCPFLYHSIYPYFLGFFYGAKYTYNNKGDCNVCCPAEKSVNVIVKMRINDGSFGKDIPKHWKTIIYAEIFKIEGRCYYGYKTGDKFFFPGSAQKKYVCPSGVNNLFPFLKLKIPKCINTNRLRCSDWLENIYYSLDNETRNKSKKK